MGVVNKDKQNKRLGETRMMNCGMEATIIKYINSMNVDIQFADGYVVKNRTYSDFKNNSIINPYAKTIYNVACLGEDKATYIDPITKRNKKFDSYVHWYEMIRRCYNPKEINKFKNYNSCTVCEEWLNYSTFKKWYNNNYYKVNNEEMRLDKDILIKGNKIYSPETCIFVPNRINVLFTNRKNDRGKYPIGVYLYNGKFKSQCSTHKDGVTSRILIGTFNTSEEAFYSYKEFKEKYIKEVADEYKDRIPKKLYDAMYKYEVEITD